MSAIVTLARIVRATANTKTRVAMPGGLAGYERTPEAFLAEKGCRNPLQWPCCTSRMHPPSAALTGLSARPEAPVRSKALTEEPRDKPSIDSDASAAHLSFHPTPHAGARRNKSHRRYSGCPSPSDSEHRRRIAWLALFRFGHRGRRDLIANSSPVSKADLP